MTHGDWAWRRRIRSNAHSHRVYRVVVGVVGALIVLLGLILVPFPGPGWLIVFLGVGIWASEFAWASRLLHWARDRLRSWNAWLQRQPLWLRGLVLALTLALLLALAYAYLLWQGIPRLVPEAVATPLRAVLRL